MLVQNSTSGRHDGSSHTTHHQHAEASRVEVVQNSLLQFHVWHAFWNFAMAMRKQLRQKLVGSHGYFLEQGKFQQVSRRPTWYISPMEPAPPITPQCAVKMCHPSSNCTSFAAVCHKESVD